MHDRILDAAVRVFSRDGFHRARMERIAREAGVAVGTIYNYFRGKDELLLAIFQAEFEERIRFFEDLQRSGLPPREQIRRLLTVHFREAREKRDLSQVLLAERFSRDAGFREAFVTWHRQILHRIAGIIERGVEEGWVRRCNPRVIALALYGVGEWLAAGWTVYEASEAEDVFAEAPGELADWIWQGLRADVAP